MTKSIWFVEFTRDKFISLDEQLLPMFTQPQDALESSFQASANFSLSKLAAKQQIDELEIFQYLEPNNRLVAKNLSLKYQVLSEGTQFIGVVRFPKQQDFDISSDELLTIDIPTVRARLPK